MNITIEADAMTIHIARTPRTVWINGERVTVTELGPALAFSRKPARLADVGGGELQRVYITVTHEMTTGEFDDFVGDLGRSREWMTGEGGSVGDAFLCLEIVAPDRPALYVNPEGSSYARYVARLG
ncbi:hypothetical protein OOT46_30310 [Aquabacterium sp. A7-Y]|uniref:hypothetical protein n=1 Tax=Aquabacterium sp. A7-Y TaxID=1349605 RepID=UPI00223DDB6D|nr:hypothetical protein [Aquabacterium sp. A7-Y]MCW7542092.1 hypothetical protein [Aquabacterium sp. A7-Y]